MEKLSEKLFEIGAIKFGSFTLKSGIVSPIYIDLRLLASHPDVLWQVAEEMEKILKKIKCDRIAAVPYAAMPIGTALSLKAKIPMVYCRKEAKEYGTKKRIEGEFKEGETIAVIDDLVTTAASKFEAILPLEGAGLKVTDIIVLIDREQGGREELKKKGYALHSCLKLSEMLKELKNAGKITERQLKDTEEFLRKNRSN